MTSPPSSSRARSAWRPCPESASSSPSSPIAQPGSPTMPLATTWPIASAPCSNRSVNRTSLIIPRMTNAMSPTWQDVCCASIPAQDLPILADLRRRPEIRVSMVGDRAWICWDPELESLRRILVERLLPLSRVEMFARRGGHWYRPGDHLPAFGLPIGDANAGLPLKNVLFPRPMTVASSTSHETTTPSTLRLVRDLRNQHRPAPR